ncbi:MAG TPA: 2-octaprenyl-3-methyl-6-methoxy-1,4-benzoquinol hydroxylase, partial [Xanthomonadaceae bacterium]|nr:2-octaprenyl-3-methyl-6-methoxy-1,4-benzoquinol hydroxylase [Xanthomonadaceae bacterium]
MSALRPTRPADEAIVVGAGIVGSALALGLRQRGTDVTVLDPAPPAVWRADAPDLRVYAIAADAKALLERLGVWASIRARRVSPYSVMRVWDAAGGGELGIEADLLGVPQLGHIVEHALLAEALQSAAELAGVRVERGAAFAGIEAGGGTVTVRLADGRRLRTRWLFGADGARSAVREAAGIAVDACDYATSGLVAYVRGERPHAATAWQRFLPGGPLALLPCADGRVSIVWSLPEAEARRLVAAPVALFDAELTRASDRVLGALALDGERRLFPLKRQLAVTMARDRVALLGDAAHVVHPLAGQGVNLGLRDVAALLAAVDAGQARGGDGLTPARLARWARERGSENALAAHAFEAIHRVYASSEPLPMALRAAALGIADLQPIKRRLWRAA